MSGNTTLYYITTDFQIKSTPIESRMIGGKLAFALVYPIGIDPFDGRMYASWQDAHKTLIGRLKDKLACTEDNLRMAANMTEEEWEAEQEDRDE